MRRWLLGPAATCSSHGTACTTQRVFKAFASRTYAPIPTARPTLLYRPLLLNVTAPRVSSMASCEQDRRQRVCNASFSSASRRQKDPYTVLGVPRSATGLIMRPIAFHTFSPWFHLLYVTSICSQGNQACLLQRS